MVVKQDFSLTLEMTVLMSEMAVGEQ